MQYDLPHPSWMVCGTPTQIAADTDTVITKSGMYHLNVGTGVILDVQISDEEITQTPTWQTATFSFRGDTAPGRDQYIEQGQHIRSNNTFTMTHLHT